MPSVELSPKQIAEQVAAIGKYERITAGELERQLSLAGDQHAMTTAANMLNRRSALEARWLLKEWFVIEPEGDDE